ncbi:Fic family protein [Lachnoclostridium sp. MSJ-17]|nr:Fic family protein [Lachnoclostridium sp. MSJ-17]
MKWYTDSGVIVMQKYPFQINTKILRLTSEISELVGSMSSLSEAARSPQLRRSNRIKTIYSSLAIEQNTLSLDQVTAVVSGKRVLAPPKDIAEVQNAFEIYDRLDELNPYSIDDLLTAHAVMVRGLRDDAGEFRLRPVGVVDSQGNILHFGTLPAYVPQLVEELLDWTENDENPLLIKSCVFHYEFELIHPFSDGNGRIGRLWHTLLLSKWNPLFAWVPVESIIHDRQSEYYLAINNANNAADSTCFIEFMLSAIKDALLEVTAQPLKVKPRAESREQAVLDYLSKYDEIANRDVRNLLSISAATANRVLNEMVNKGLIFRFRKGKLWAYRKKG